MADSGRRDNPTGRMKGIMARLLASLKSSYQSTAPIHRGMLLVLISTFAFSGMHAVIRHLSSDLHPFEIAFFRNLFGLFALAPFFWRHGLTRMLGTQRLPLHALRGVLQIFGMFMFFYGVSLTPLAKVSALSFTAPLFATIGAVIFLGEKIRARRITALVLGFIGALVILRPGAVALDTGALLILGSSAIWSVALLMIKALSRTESSVTLTAYMGLVMTPLSFLVAVFFWQWPKPEEYFWFCIMGGLGTIGHVLLAQALKEAEATAVLPVDFTRLIWASLLGFMLFGQIPELWTWIGGTIIFASTTYIAFRETRLKGG